MHDEESDVKILHGVNRYVEKKTFVTNEESTCWKETKNADRIDQSSQSESNVRKSERKRKTPSSLDIFCHDIGVSCLNA